MRVIIYALFLSLASCGCGEPEVNSTHPESKATQRLPKVYFVPESSLTMLNDSGKYVTMKFGHVREHFYLISPDDTFTYKYWYEYSVPSWMDTVHVPLHNTTKIYREEEFREIVMENYDQDSMTCYLLNHIQDSNAVIGVCELIPTQLDSDDAREYIVEYKADGWSNRHFMFDDAAHQFKFHGVQNIGNRFDDHPVDTSLKGYFGLFQESLWGTGEHEFSNVFYRLTEDSLEFCFTLAYVHSVFYYSLFGDEYDPTMIVEGTPTLLSDGKINIRYEMSFELKLFNDTQVVFVHRSYFDKIISRNASDSEMGDVVSVAGEFERPPTGYDAMDSMMAELRILKVNGTKRQKYYLRNVFY